jgi:FkbM family methyltransferase
VTRAATKSLPFGKRVLVKTVWTMLGRQNMVRLARFLDYQGRLDVPNFMETNGEREVQRCVLQRVTTRRAPTFVDVGANVGDWTFASLAVVSEAGRPAPRAHLFDPAPEACRILRTRFASQIEAGTLVVNQVGLSKDAGVAELHMVGPTAGTNSLHAQPGSDAQRVRVSLATLDDYCEERGVQHIELLKVDAEGHDLSVLRGGARLLRTQSIDVVQFEYNRRWIFARSFLKDAFDFLMPLGYKVGKVTPRGIELYESWDPELETFHEGNYLAMRAGAEGWFTLIPWWGTL